MLTCSWHLLFRGPVLAWGWGHSEERREADSWRRGCGYDRPSLTGPVCLVTELVMTELDWTTNLPLSFLASLYPRADSMQSWKGSEKSHGVRWSELGGSLALSSKLKIPICQLNDKTTCLYQAPVSTWRILDSHWILTTQHPFLFFR